MAARTTTTTRRSGAYPAVAALVLATVLLTGGLAATASTGFHSCRVPRDLQPAYAQGNSFTNLRESNTTCRRARRVIRQADDFSGNPFESAGFYCHAVNGTLSYHCDRIIGPGRVRFVFAD